LVNPTWQFPSPVPREKGQFTCRQTRHSGDGIIRGSSWTSDKRINASIFFKSRRRPIHLDFLRGSCAQVGNCGSAKHLKNWPSGNSIVLRTRRSNLAPVYV